MLTPKQKKIVELMYYPCVVLFFIAVLALPIVIWYFFGWLIGIMAFVVAIAFLASGGGNEC